MWETSYWWEEERKRYFPHFQERGRKIEAGTNAWSCSDQHSVHVSHQLLNLAQSPLRQLDVFEGLGQNGQLKTLEMPRRIATGLFGNETALVHERRLNTRLQRAAR